MGPPLLFLFRLDRFTIRRMASPMTASPTTPMTAQMIVAFWSVFSCCSSDAPSAGAADFSFRDSGTVSGPYFEPAGIFSFSAARGWMMPYP
ncbi:hypothetical protein AQI96_23895 [Streptomyces canus]|nr:hypothetical protein AQI96_23895 [Streptomyces canus]